MIERDALTIIIVMTPGCPSVVPLLQIIDRADGFLSLLLSSNTLALQDLHAWLRHNNGSTRPSVILSIKGGFYPNRPCTIRCSTSLAERANNSQRSDDAFLPTVTVNRYQDRNECCGTVTPLLPRLFTPASVGSTFDRGVHVESLNCLREALLHMQDLPDGMCPL